MFSKLKRGKADKIDEPPKLRGMPALKQERQSKRNGLISPTSPSNIMQQRLTEFDRTGVTSNLPEMKFIGSKPDILQNTHEHTPVRGTANGEAGKACHKLKNEKKLKENGTRSTTKFDEEHQEHEMTVAKENGKALDDKTEKGKGKENDKRQTASKPKKERTNKNNGRRLHSVKKQRNASRNGDVTTSMRALTPRERESILFFEEALREIDQASSRGSDQENDMFDANDVDDSASDSDSCGSIIDLVGNLCASRSPYSTESKLQSIKDPHADCEAERSANNVIRSKYVSNRIYAEIADVDDRTTEQTLDESDVYQEIMINSNNNNSKTPSTSGKLIQEPSPVVGGSNPPAAARSEQIEKQVNAEPVYSVVKKVKKPTSKRSSQHEKVSEDQNAKKGGVSSVKVLPKPEANEEEVTAKNSRKFWNDLSKNKPGRVKSMYNPTSSVYALPSLPETSVDSNNLSALTNIDESLRAKPRKFVVVPNKGKTPPAVVPRKPSTKLKRHQSERSHAEHLKLKSSNRFIKDRLNFDQAGSRDDTNNDHDQNMIAIPRQTTLYDRSGGTSNSKPFVITPANKRVVSWN